MTLLARINDFVQADALYISILQLYDIMDIMVCILCSVLNIYNTQICFENFWFHSVILLLHSNVGLLIHEGTVPFQLPLLKHCLVEGPFNV